LSGTTLIRPSFPYVPLGWMTSTVPSQLLPTNSTGRRTAAAAGPTATAAGANPAAMAAAAAAILMASGRRLRGGR
jgi:hypothetical protein